MADVLLRQRPVERRKYTVADFDWLAQLPQYQDARFELIQGELEDMPPPSVYHAILSRLLDRLIGAYVDQHGLGYMTGEGGHYSLSDEATVLVPDCAFIRAARLADPTSHQAAPVMPDLAVEVKSPNDSTLQLRRKALLYLERGTAIVWLVYPERRQVEVCALDAEGEIQSEVIGADGDLSGGDVLPGFTLPLSRLFS